MTGLTVLRLGMPHSMNVTISRLPNVVVVVTVDVVPMPVPTIRLLRLAIIWPMPPGCFLQAQKTNTTMNSVKTVPKNKPTIAPGSSLEKRTQRK